MREDAVVVRQACCRHLKPGLAPKHDRRLELVAGGERDKIAIGQPNHIQRHERQAAQVALGWRQRFWKIGHSLTLRCAQNPRRSPSLSASGCSDT
jgi:hypothetical protein